VTKRQQRVTRPAARPPVLLLAAAGALLLVIAGVLIIANQPGVSPATAAGARVAVEPEAIDFGKVQVEQPLTARFVVRNEGDETLQILGQPQVRLVEGC
jgi:hypothetical protein